MSTQFIKRAEPRDGEVTIRLYQDADALLGEVICPGGVEGTHTAAGADADGVLGIHQALASAIELCETRGNIVGVVDEDGLWREEWGDLIQDA